MGRLEEVAPAEEMSSFYKARDYSWLNKTKGLPTLPTVKPYQRGSFVTFLTVLEM